MFSFWLAVMFNLMSIVCSFAAVYLSLTDRLPIAGFALILGGIYFCAGTLSRMEWRMDS